MKVLTGLLLFAATLTGETGREAWLRYAPAQGVMLPAVVVGAESAAREELIRGVRGMTGHALRIAAVAKEPAIRLVVGGTLPADAFSLKTVDRDVVITASNHRGVLYGVFALLRRSAMGEPLNVVERPRAPVRWVNEWNNLDGTIERGYGGRSIFFDGGAVRADLTRVSEYARLLASVGINGCAINNVNADPRVLTAEFLAQAARVAAVMRPWGVRVVLAVDFGSPKRTGGLETFDPLNPAVEAWWKSRVDEVYRAIPDLAGFVMKADSEGRVGPSAYGRTHADAANTVARALRPHGGLIFYRAFVSDHNMDWRNLKNDRARAAYDNFHPLDGKFDDNVVVQIKHGPIDFQVREPASPLFAGLEKTKKAIELQITQEYFGQARHIVYLAPMWKDALDTDLYAGHAGTPVKSLVSGFVGVSNVGLDENWFGNHLSQANLYAFGRLAWDADLSAHRIAEEWTRVTFGGDAAVARTVVGLQMESWRTYENYTGPLGLQTLTAIAGDHFGPSVESSERNGWGQWHRSDERGTGMDRTSATGTGYAAQYRGPLARAYEQLKETPDDLVLFFHHVPYSHVLRSGKTVIQTIYDLHYDGATAAAGFVTRWKALEGRVDEARYSDILKQLEYQAGAAELWRDAICGWFRKTSGIEDARGRVGHYAGRTEAEAMSLDGYSVIPVTPWEGASGGQAVECKAARCSASFRFEGAAGWYDVNVRYFDVNDGAARFELRVGEQLMDEWKADDRFPTRRIDSSSSTLRVVRGIALRPGDLVRISGLPDGRESAALDYVEVIRSRTPE